MFIERSATLKVRQNSQTFVSVLDQADQSPIVVISSVSNLSEKSESVNCQVLPIDNKLLMFFCLFFVT